MPGRLSYAMSSTRTKSKTLLSWLQYSSTHWGPSMPSRIGVAEVRLPAAVRGRHGNPTSAAFISEPSRFFPVAMFFGTWMKCPDTDWVEPGAKS